MTVVVVLGIMLAGTAQAGSLREREQELAEKKAKKKKEKSTSTSGTSSSFSSAPYPSSSSDGFFDHFWMGLLSAPFRYNPEDPDIEMLPDDAAEDWAGNGAIHDHWHIWGEHTIPYARADYNWQFIDSADEVRDIRFELGYRLFGFQGRMTRYTEPDGYTLDLNQYYGLLRIGGVDSDVVPGAFEVGLGVGMVYHSGTFDDSSAALTVPIKYYPVDYFGIEFRPAWYRWMDVPIGDYDISASLGWRFLQMRYGYRWIWDDGMVDEQSGPYAGVSISF